MSQYLENMEVGDFIDVREPSGLLVYEGQGIYKTHVISHQAFFVNFAHKNLLRILASCKQDVLLLFISLAAGNLGYISTFHSRTTICEVFFIYFFI